MLVAPPIATKALAIPTSTNLSLASPPLADPPLPSPPALSDDNSDDESDDEEPTKLPQPPAPNTAIISSNTLPPSLSSLLPKSIASITSTTSDSSSLGRSSTTNGTSRTGQTTLSTSATTDTFQLSSLSSSSQLENNEPTSTSASTSFSTATSSSSSTTSTSTSGSLSAATALPIGQPDSGHETTDGSSPLSTAGIILAAVFGFIALVTTIYLLYRLRRRRQKQESSSSDSEKQNPLAFTAQETGVIFGRRGSSARSLSNIRGQHDGQQPRGTGRSRFSFLNRTWYSNGTRLSTTQQHQEFDYPQTNHNNSTEPPTPTPPSWPSPFFFTLGQRPTTDSPSYTTTQSYPPHPQTPQTATTITRLTNDIHRNISTRGDQSGSGHARAYAHHGFDIHAPKSNSIVSAARTTICSISSRWTQMRARPGNSNSDSRLSTATFGSRDGVRNSDAVLGTRNIASPISEISDLYRGNERHSYSHTSQLPPPPPPPPRKHRSSSTSSKSTPASTPQKEIDTNVEGHNRWSSRSRSRSSQTTIQSLSSTTPQTTRPNSHGSRTSRALSVPRLPLPVVVSHGSWGSKIGI